MNLYEKYQAAEKAVKDAQSELDMIKAEIYTKHMESLESIDYGKSFTTEEDGFKVSITKKETVSVDQTLASVVELGFNKKYSLNKTAYKKLSAEDQKRVDECLTTKPAKPGFKVEAL